MDLSLPSVQQCYYANDDNVTNENLIIKDCPTDGGHYSCGVNKYNFLFFVYIIIKLIKLIYY